jgi:membrane peptidoglycan carboxypeptidase
MDYKGQVSLASALAQSLNIPAVKLANQVGIEKILNFYHKA